MEDWQIRGVTHQDVRIVKGSARGWAAAAHAAGFALRVADLRAPALCEVALLSVPEARRVNDAFLEKARADLAKVDAEKGRTYELVRHLYSNEVVLGENVAAMLDAMVQESYYPNWVVLESMNID